MVYLPEPKETPSLRGLTLDLPCPRNGVVGLRTEVPEAAAATIEAISFFFSASSSSIPLAPTLYRTVGGVGVRIIYEG